MATSLELEPHVRDTYWAEVRLPPERRLPAGVIPVDAGVTTADPRNVADAPRPLSPSSAPAPYCALRRTPRRRPPGDLAVTRTPEAAGGAELVVTVTDPPVAYPLAIALFRLAVWVQWPNEDIQPAAGPDGTSFGSDWPVLEDSAVTVTAPALAPPASAADPLTVLLAFVDPLAAPSRRTPSHLRWLSLTVASCTEPAELSSLPSARPSSFRGMPSPSANR